MKKLFLVYLLLLSQLAWAQDPSSWGQPGGDYLLTGARIMVAPGRTVQKGNIHVVDGKIAEVGVGVRGNPGSRRVDLSGRVVHAGFIDPYVTGDRVGLEQESGTPVSGEHPRVHDDYRVDEYLELEKETFEELRELGFVALAVAPTHGIFRGQSAVYRASEGSESLIRPAAYSVVKFAQLGWDKLKGENYPLSYMGCVALFRQTLLDAEWYERARTKQGFVANPPRRSSNLESLAAVRKGKRLLLAESNSFVDVLRLLNVLAESGVSRSALVLSGEEWKALSWLEDSTREGQAFIVPLNFPKDPELDNGLGQEDRELEILRGWYFAPANPRWLRERGLEFSFTTHGLKSLDDFPQRVREAVAAGLSEADALAALTTEPAELLGLERDYGTVEKGKSASFVIREGGPFAEESVIREVWVDGRRYLDYKTLVEGEKPEKEEYRVRDFIRASNYSSPPSILPSPHSPAAVLVKNVTVWTQGAQGVLPSADVLVRNGKVASVGSGLSSTGAEVIDGTGLHLTPGIIDAHSHTAVDGMVNEPGANVTAMVRMKDVLNPFDHDLYLQLASGVTTANILHGSANAIGGQSITCKWRLGEPPEKMVFEEAPEGIKFALGENPKQSNWGDAHRTRYPQSRMGVTELIRSSFLSARNYAKLKAEGKNPKPDLKLEALLEVLNRKRLVHCHSYRQDEILALMRVAEEVGFKVDVFQHVLEGYKVADQLVKHGAAASTFADWWAYKVEVEDAIPHNASLLTEAGVNTTVNSDSPDLARRLNTEAAKSRRYGNMSETEAMNLITRNGAYQLGILEHTGTIERGKDADFVLWSDHPLTQNAIVLETWIDGKRYFRRADEAGRVARLRSERQRYLAALNSEKEEK